MQDIKRFVPSARGQIISRRTYQRPTNEEGTTFETWAQVIDRVVRHQRWLWENALGTTLNADQQDELEELRELLLDRKVAVSGRTFWLGGTDIAKTVSVSQFNCFSRSTPFVTSDGVRTFEHFEHGDTCLAMAADGTYESAVVKKYGEQPLNAVTFVRGSASREYKVTENHRWLLADGSETTSLKVGDVLASPKRTFWDWEWVDAPVDEQLWWCYGFVYGDGAISTSGGSRTSRVRLCGAKNDFLPRFTSMGFGHSLPPSCNTDAMVYTGKYLKTLPASSDDIRLIRAFLWGWLNADGGKTSGGRHTPYDSLQCSDAEGIEFFRKHATACGLFISSERDVTNRDTAYTSDKTAIRFQLYSAASTHHNSRWHVKSMVPAGTETVWCLEVENQHNFVLADGMVTGNCAAIQASKVHDMVDIFWGLLNGAGEGSRPVPGTLTGFRRHIPTIKFIPSNRGKNDKGPEHNVETFDEETGEWRIVIGDSARAWAKSLGKLLAGKYAAKSLVLDFTNIRGAGQRLRNYGWISQGDIGLGKAYAAIVDILNDRADQLLTHMNILDIVNHLGTVLSTRRAAEILVYDYGADGWEQFARAKNGIFAGDGMTVTGLEHRGQSNNSLMFRTKPSLPELVDILRAMDKGGKGEPGIINAETMKRRAPWADLLNPCVPGDTKILTDKGHVPIKDTIGKLIVVWNGSEWSEVNPFYTGHKMVYAVELSDGSTLNCTGNHKFVLADGYSGKTFRKEVKDLNIGDKLAKFAMPVIHEGETYDVDAYSQGFYSGDGNDGLRRSWLYAPKYCCAERLVGSISEENANVPRKAWVHGIMEDKRFVPINGTSDYCLNWLAGLLDSDGTVTRDKNGNGFQITSVDNAFLQDVKLMLTRLGVQAKIVMGAEAGTRLLPDGRGGHAEYECKTGYRLLVGNQDTYHLGRLGLHTNRLEWHKDPPQRDARRFTSIVSITPVGEEDVYCFNEPINHTGTFNGVVTGQCGEILLSATGGVCNLVTIPLNRYIGDTPGLHRAAHLIARANYRQSCVSFNDGILQESWDLNNDHLHLMGVSLMGVVQRPDMTAYDYTRLRRTVTVAAYGMADELGTPHPKNITTMKPEGTISKCYDSTEGMHRPLGKYVFNNVAFSIHDPMVDTLKQAGYRVFNHPYDETAKLVTLPVCYDDVDFGEMRGKEVDTESAIDQLERYKMLMQSWCDQNVSCTISYESVELDEIAVWLHNNWDNYVAVSFLKRNDVTKTAADLGYPYLPQEIVDADTYHVYVDGLKPVHFDEDSVVSVEYELDSGCAGGVCPVR